MTIDATTPVDSVPIRDIPSYIRNLTAALTTSAILVTEVEIAAIDTEIPASTVAIEILLLSATAAASPSTITAATSGSIKIIIFADSDVTLLDAVGNISLRGNPGDLDYPASVGDIMVLIYIPSTGMWTEVVKSMA